MFEKFAKIHSLCTSIGGKRMQNASIYTSYQELRQGDKKDKKQNMNTTEYLDKFYDSVLGFLTKNSLEELPQGFCEEEIKNYETKKAIEFPKAYRLFLSLMAKSNLRIFDSQDFTISGLNDAEEVSQELLEKDKHKLGPNQFVFSQWQGYNFYYLDLNSENPDVELYIQAGCAFEGSPAEIYKYGRFTDWLCKKIEISLNLRKRLEGLEIEELLDDLEKIRVA